MDGLDLATATWKQSKGFPRARGQRCRVMGSGHDDRLSTDWGAYAEADTIYLMRFSKLVIFERDFVCTLTWGALRIPVLRYRCQFVSQLFVVVVGDRRALPAQTLGSLQPA